MKRFYAATAICALMAASSGIVNAPAMATDILSDAEKTGDYHIDEQIRQELRWSGFYVGIAGTIGMTNTALDADIGDNWDIYEGAYLDGLGGEGAGITGILGYDQRLGRFIVGGFADFTYSDDLWQTEFGADDVTSGDDHSFSGEINREHDWTAGARIGALVNPNTMLYALAGYSQMKVGAVEIDGAALDGSQAVTFDGYTVGAGLESKVNDFTSFYVEGRWSEYDSETVYTEEEDLTVTAEPSEVKAMAGIKIRLLTE